MRNNMTRYAAAARARSLWEVPASRHSFASIRRKSVVDRYEVGYNDFQGLRTVMGRGPSWEATTRPIKGCTSSSPDRGIALSSQPPEWGSKA